MQPNQTLNPAQPEVALELDMQRGPAREWVTQEPVQRKISAIFRKFLRDFTDEQGELVYRQRMRDMVTSAAQVSGLGWCTIRGMPPRSCSVCEEPC